MYCARNLFADMNSERKNWSDVRDAASSMMLMVAMMKIFDRNVSSGFGFVRVYFCRSFKLDFKRELETLYQIPYL